MEVPPVGIAHTFEMSIAVVTCQTLWFCLVHSEDEALKWTDGSLLTDVFPYFSDEASCGEEGGSCPKTLNQCEN